MIAGILYWMVMLALTLFAAVGIVAMVTFCAAVLELKRWFPWL